jgi:nucleotide-binding universal stress UspA family protein
MLAAAIRRDEVRGLTWINVRHAELCQNSRIRTGRIIMRSILVFADRSASMVTRLESALDMARMTGGHVSILVDTPATRYVSMDPLGGSFVATDALQQALAADDDYAAGIARRLAGQDVPFDVIRADDDPISALTAAARLADVVVVSRDGGMGGDVALSARTPVLVLQDDCRLQFPLAKAAIAWDGGDEAALALRGAVPLLAGCASVSVLCVAEKVGGFPSSDALRYLSRHGIVAEMKELVRSGSTEETLADEVARSGADLLVMGAYGHSRMREFLFGGVTRFFLEDSGPALLLAH